MSHTILMIAPTSFFSDYGCHVRIWEEIQALQTRGHAVVLTTYHNGHDMPDLDIRRSWDVPWIKRAMVGSTRHKLYLDVALSWRSLRVAVSERPTIIHAHLHEGALIGAVLKRVLGVPLVFDYQGSLTGEMLDHGFLSASSPVYTPLKHLERSINRQADAIIPSTHNAAAILQQDDPQLTPKLHTVTDNVNITRFRPFDGSPAWEQQRQALRAQLGIPANRRIVVYLGLLAPYQGTNLLLEAAQRLVRHLPDVHFLIMGYPDPESYRAYATTLGIGDHVTLPGRILYHDAHAYLALGDVAVAPKMSATEGNGKLGNYMAMGLPIVTFDTPVSREFLDDTGVYAHLGSVDDLASKLEQVLQDRTLSTRLGKAARERAVTCFAWDHAADQLEAVYADVLARSYPTRRPRSPVGKNTPSRRRRNRLPG